MVGGLVGPLVNAEEWGNKGGNKRGKKGQDKWLVEKVKHRAPGHVLILLLLMEVETAKVPIHIPLAAIFKHVQVSTHCQPEKNEALLNRKFCPNWTPNRPKSAKLKPKMGPNNFLNWF